MAIANTNAITSPLSPPNDWPTISNSTVNAVNSIAVLNAFFMAKNLPLLPIDTRPGSQQYNSALAAVIGAQPDKTTACSLKSTRTSV